MVSSCGKLFASSWPYNYELLCWLKKGFQFSTNYIYIYILYNTVASFMLRNLNSLFAQVAEQEIKCKGRIIFCVAKVRLHIT